MFFGKLKEFPLAEALAKPNPKRLNFCRNGSLIYFSLINLEIIFSFYKGKIYLKIERVNVQFSLIFLLVENNQTPLMFKFYNSNFAKISFEFSFELRYEIVRWSQFPVYS